MADVFRQIVSGNKKIMAIQLDAIAPANEGVERVLDEVQQRAGVNVLMIDCLWFTEFPSRAELEKTPLMGHHRDPNSRLVGGRMGFIRPEYYKNTGLELRPLAAPPGVPDILAEFCAAAKRRKLPVIPIIKDYLPDGDGPSDIPAAGWEALCELDFNGARANTSCKANPRYRALLAGIMEDMIRSYDVDGIMYIAERQGAFTDTLGLRFRGTRRGLPGNRTCFCPHCQAKAKERGISFERAKRGFEELAKFTAAGRVSQRPVDGYYATLWRLMLRYPELLAWEHLWHENLREVYQFLHATIKGIRPDLLYGMHVWPNINMSPLLSAEHDFAELGAYHDFIKVSIYSNCGGPRFGNYIDSVSQTMYGDMPPEEVLRFHYRVMNYDEAPLAKIREVGLKNDFVHRESKRMIASARGTKALMLPGIDIDIATDIDRRMSDLKKVATNTRDDVRQGIAQAFKAGVPGVVLSRQYSEMQLDNLSGVGDAIAELRIKT